MPRDLEDAYHVSLCATDRAERCGLDTAEQGACVELCFTADMSKVALTE